MTEWMIGQFMRGFAAKATIECMRAIANGDFQADMRAVTVPTPVVHGDKDQVNPLERTARQVTPLISAARSRYEGAPHGLAITHRVRLAQDFFVRS